MAHFSHHSSNNILDNDQTVFVPNPNVGTSSCFPDQFHQQLSHGHSFLGYQHDHVSVANKLQIPDSSVSLLLLDGKKIVDQNGNELVLERNGKDKQMSSVCQPHQSKDTSKRLKKQKKTSDYDQEEVNKKNTKKVSSSSSKEEGTVGYVHVRARRGQATDSHSLAERVRREKISERMKVLQSIVPGCDKVTGKAPMLDEIINYVRSLQNQVELLSMKLATLNPMLYDFGVDLDAIMLKSNENMSSSMAVPSLQHYSQNATFAPTNFNYINHQRLNIDGSGGATNYSQSFPQSQMPIIHSQGNVYRLWDVDEQIRKKIDNRFAVCNSFAFQ